MSGDRNRFSRSKSPKARWQDEPQAKDSDTSKDATSEKENKGEEEVRKEEDSLVNGGSEVPKVQRKRKWLGTDQAANATLLNSKKQLTISSDTLKSYLPAAPSLKEKAAELVVEEKEAAAETVASAEVTTRRVIDSNAKSARLNGSLERKVILEVNKKRTLIS